MSGLKAQYKHCVRLLYLLWRPWVSAFLCQALRCPGGSSSLCCIEVPPTHGTSLQRQRVLRRKTLMLHYLPLWAVAHQACARSTQMPPAHGKKPKAL